MNLNNFNLVKPFQNKHLTNYNNYNLKSNLKIKFIKPKFFLKLNSYFNVFYKNLKFINNYNSMLIFNKDNIFINKNFVNFFYSLLFKKKNFIILDSDYSHIYPLYKFIYGVNSLQLYKNFFFLKPIYFTRKN